jgi:FkbM family methyltransferase
VPPVLCRCDNGSVSLGSRVVGAVSRRLGRPELMATLYAGARQEQRDTIAISAVLAATLPREGTYVDVGTNRGQVLGEAVRIAARGRHIAFEPLPHLAAEVKRAFPAVDCRPVALGNRSEVARFCHFTALDGWSGLRRSAQVSDRQGKPEYINVQVSTLDLELTGIQPDVIKIDVEGAELAVLEGGYSLLGEARPIVIFEHVAQAAALYEAQPQDVWDLLGGLGYDIFSITGEGPFSRASFARETTGVNWLARPDGGRARA